MHSLIAFLFGIVVGAAIALVGFWLTHRTWEHDVEHEVDEAFESAFATHWKIATSSHESTLKDYGRLIEVQQHEWNQRQEHDITLAKARRSGEPNAIKGAVDAFLQLHQHASLDSIVVSPRGLLSATIRLPGLLEVIRPKSKQLSDATGKVISRKKPMDEREIDYGLFAAGTALNCIVEILNTTQFCERLQIALFSEQRGRNAYHVCGELRRRNLPQFQWNSVDPRRLLKGLGFRIEGGSAKKHTDKPAWLKRLDQLRIGTSPTHTEQPRTLDIKAK